MTQDEVRAKHQAAINKLADCAKELLAAHDELAALRGEVMDAGIGHFDLRKRQPMVIETKTFLAYARKHYGVEA